MQHLLVVRKEGVRLHFAATQGSHLNADGVAGGVCLASGIESCLLRRIESRREESTHACTKHHAPGLSSFLMTAHPEASWHMPRKQYTLKSEGGYSLHTPWRRDKHLFQPLFNLYQNLSIN